MLDVVARCTKTSHESRKTHRVIRVIPLTRALVFFPIWEKLKKTKTKLYSPQHRSTKPELQLLSYHWTADDFQRGLVGQRVCRKIKYRWRIIHMQK